MKQNQITIKDVQNIEKNPEALLKIQPTRFNKSAKKYLNGLTIKDFENNKKLTINTINAIHVYNARKGITDLKKYNLTISEIKTIMPNIYEACKINPRHINFEEAKIIKDMKNLEETKNIKVSKGLLWNIHDFHKGKEAIKYIRINEINDYVGIIKHFYKTKGFKKTRDLINQIFDIIFTGCYEKTTKNIGIEWFPVKK